MLTVTKADNRHGKTHEDYNAMAKICLENSGKDFTSDSERAIFLDQWLRPYWEKFYDSIFLLLRHDQVHKELVGYATVCPDTLKALSYNYPWHSSLSLFKQFYQQYPAHLHINIDKMHRSSGGGAMLMHAVYDYLKDIDVQGLHIITGENARNQSFYLRMGMKILEIKKTEKVGYQLMGILINNWCK